MPGRLRSYTYVKVKVISRMRVDELATRSGASPRSIRHYDRAGLLTSVRRPNGYRDFPLQAIEEVRVVKRLLASGLSVADIVTLQPCLTVGGEFNGCAEARSILRRHIARLTASIQRDQKTLAHLREREDNMFPAGQVEQSAG